MILAAMTILGNRRRCSLEHYLRPVSALVPLLLAIQISGCKEEIVPEPYVPSNAHDGYAHALRQANLDEAALGRDWLAASRVALNEAVEVTTPFQEVFYIDHAEAFAVGYRFQVARGQRMEAQVELNGAASMRLFMDLYRVMEEPTDGQAHVHVASGAEHELRLEFEPRRDGEYLLRLQPELLRGGQLTVVIRSVRSLEFPVQGRTTSAVLSGFGVPRDAGRRTHHGVDIFAPRHTPVLATSRALVRRVDRGDIGGRVIWLRDPERSLSIYFAHLETQEVDEGSWVEPGDRIGTVGNSGNAKTTAPHLHFGIYARREGPVDPYPFIHQPETEPRKLSVDLDILGSWARTIVNGISLRTVPDRRAQPLRDLDLHTPLRVWGGTGGLYRVTLPDGMSGYVTARGISSLHGPIQREAIAVERTIFDQPSGRASVVERIAPGEEVPVLGRYGEYLYVMTPSGRSGWMPSN